MKIYKIILLLACSAHTAFSQYMPEGFEDIKIGMSREDLLEMRPMAKNSSSMEKFNNDENKMVEYNPVGEINPALIDRMISYNFKNNALVTVEFIFKNIEINSFLNHSFNAMGQNFILSKSTINNHNSICWIRANEVALITIPVDYKAGTLYEFYYQIMQPDYFDEFNKFKKNILSKKNLHYGVSEDFKKRITAYAEGVLAEVEAQAEVTDVPLAVVAKAEGKSADQDGEYANTEYSEATVKKTVVLVLTAIALVLGFGLFYRLKR